MKPLGPFYRTLAALHRAGVPWPQAIESASGGHKTFAPVWTALGRGVAFTEATASVLDPLDVAILDAAEQRGGLEDALTGLAEEHEARGRLRSERHLTLLYPVLLAHLAAFLLPIPDLIQKRGAVALLWSAAILVPLYTIFAVQWWGRRRRSASGPGAEPPVPRLTRGPWRSAVEEADAQALDALGRLYDAGVPLERALDLAAGAGWGGRTAVALKAARREVISGGDLSAAWGGLHPDVALRLRSAEAAGGLGEALRYEAEVLRAAILLRRRRTAAVLPVAVMLIVGAVVAVRVFSFYAGVMGR